ncbi:MAG: serine hydrolase domain-containing protein [Bacteroidota bacterium]
MEKNLYSILISLIWGLCFNYHSLVAQQEAYLKTVEAIVDSIYEAEELPSLSVGVLLPGRAPIFINRGYHDRSEKKEVDEHSIYQIASLSKMMAGVIANNLLLEGEIKLEQPITDFLPASISDKTRQKLSVISFRELLHHRAGLPRNAKVGYKRKDGDPYLYEYTEEDLLQELAKLKLKKDPGYRYSNFGYGLLGYLLERAKETSYEELLTSYVFEPTGMEETFYTLPLDNPQLVTAYRKENRQIPTKGWVMGKLSPATTVSTTMADLLRLMRAQLQAYRKYNETQEVSSLMVSSDTEVAYEGIGDYGFGMFSWASGDFGHGGDVDGFASNYSIHPKENFGVAMLTSSGGRWTGPLIVKINKILKTKLAH